MVISYSEPTTTVRKAVTYTSTPPVDAVVGGSYGGTANGGASANPVVFTIDTTAYSAAETAQQSFTIGKATITAVV